MISRCVVAAMIAAGCSTAMAVVVPADAEPSAKRPSSTISSEGLKDGRSGASRNQRLDLLAGPQPSLSAKERRGLAYGREWARNRVAPARGEDGSIVFVFGATLPTVVCAPLYVCDLALEPGETINNINSGDSVRWKITPATQGEGDAAVTHVIIKPTDVGLKTNLIITTNRRAYTIKLISRRKEWMPKVSFQYPDNMAAAWAAHTAKQRQAAALRSALIGDNHSDDAGDSQLDFNYLLSGDEPPWRPIRVYTNGKKTYIQLPPGVAHDELPALVGLADDGGWFSEPTKQMVNYRFHGDRFEVDKVLERAALISGVGSDQIVVKITHDRRAQ